MRIAVVGAGLSGLALAQGLVREDMDVTVYERDAALDTRPQGYRIHLDGRAGRALWSCLPPDRYSLFRATLGMPGSAVSVVDDRLRVLRRTAAAANAPEDDDPASLSAPANRQTLREVLAGGLGEVIAYGREVVEYTERADAVMLGFADGSVETADVLVAADGVLSRVRRQRLPDARVRDTGARCVYGKTPLTPETLAGLPPSVLDGFTAVIGPGAVGMALGLVRFPEPPARVARRLDIGVDLSPVEDYLMWSVTGPTSAFGPPDERFLTLPPDALHRCASDAVAGWHRDLRALVDRAVVADTFAVRISSAEPVPAWPASRVTLMGDAIHAMSPAGGSGANTALTDAMMLRNALVDAARGRQPLLAAIAAYEDRMRDYGFAAVAAAGQNTAAMWARRHPILSRLVTLLPRGRG